MGTSRFNEGEHLVGMFAYPLTIGHWWMQSAMAGQSATPETGRFWPLGVCGVGVAEGRVGGLVLAGNAPARAEGGDGEGSGGGRPRQGGGRGRHRDPISGDLLGSEAGSNNTGGGRGISQPLGRPLPPVSCMGSGGTHKGCP